ncbi:MAG: translation initiation factor [Planctomycetota bacterium]
MEKKSRRTGGDGWSLTPASSELAGAPAPPLRHERGTAQRLKISLERRKRGKIVTVIRGFQLSAGELEDVARRMKSACGTGGQVNEASIELQGDLTARVADWLRAAGFQVT